MKLLILYFSLYASKPAILDNIDDMDFEEMKPNNEIINGDMNFGYLKEILKLALEYFYGNDLPQLTVASSIFRKKDSII